MAAEVSQEDKKFIQTLLAQKKEEQLYLGFLQKEEKKKVENKVVLITQHRIYFIKAGEHKIFKEAHLLDLTEIRSSSNTEIALVFKGFEIDGTTPRADDIITNIRQAYELAFYGTPEDSAIKLSVPSSRIVGLAAKDLPLGGFVNSYRAICDFYGHPPRDEICWDMEHTYSTKNIKTFDLSEFEQPLHPHDIRALITALRYNTHFKSFVASDIPFSKEQIATLADTLKTNAAIESLKLVNIGARAEAVTAICNALSANKNIAVTELELSNNPIEDKGIVAVANFIGATPKGIVRLELSNTGLGKAGTAAIGSALKKNVKTSATLFHLGLDGNKLEAEGSSSLAAYLATPNSLRTLNIASTIPSLETIIGALVRGCSELRQVNLSENKMTKKDATLLSRLISASSSLKQLTLNRTTIPADALKEVLLAIGGNVYLQDFIMEAKSNELGVTGAQAVADCSSKLGNIHTLDLDDNDFGDDGICAVADGLCNNSYLKRLDLSRNFKVAKAKSRATMLESLSNLLSSECPLEALILAGGPKSLLKGELVGLIYDLATNASLQELDISGHAMGNRGAVALGKTLQTNNTLVTLAWDDNQTTLAGFQAFKTGMERNHSLKVMALPILDIAAAIRTDPPAKVQQVIADIEKSLSRNQSPGRQFEAHKTSALGNFSVLTSGQQQNVDKLVMKIKSTGQKVEAKEDLNVIQDAGKTEKFIAGLHLMREATFQAAEDEMRDRLKAFAAQASSALHQKKSELVSQILKSLQESFQSMDQQTLRRLHTGIEFGSKDLDQAELEAIIVKATGAEISSKANETYLSCVEIASDYVYEKMEDSLKEIYGELERIAASAASAASSPAPPASPAVTRNANNSPHTSGAYEATAVEPKATPPSSPPPATPPPSNPPPATPPPATPPPATPPPATPEPRATAPASPAPGGPPKTAPRTVIGVGTTSAAGVPSPGRVAAVSGNAAVAAAIARGVGAPGGPMRPGVPLRAPRDSVMVSASPVPEREDSSNNLKEEPKKEEPKKEEPVPINKDPSKMSKDDLKKEKERKEKEEKEKKEREKKEKEEKEKKAKADKERMEKEKKEKAEKDKKKPAPPPARKEAPKPKPGPGGAAAPVTAIPVQEKPKEQELEHLTKERPKGPGNRKAPTRRPRPPTSDDA